MSMLTLNGQLVNLFDKPATTNKKTGEVYPASFNIQIQAENTLENGQKRIELITLRVARREPYAKLVGSPVRVPVGVFASAGSVVYYALPTGENSPPVSATSDEVRGARS